MSENIADTLKCPHCAANLFYDSNSGRAVCKFCGSDFDPNVLKLSFSFENKTEEKEIDDSKMQEFTCNSCGATVITDENTAATFCCYCGSPALAGHRLRREFKPDFIIPFKLTREQAEAQFLEWGRTNKYIPRGFMNKENIKKLTPLYVPFWLVDSECDAVFYGTGTIYDRGNKSRTVFSLEREIGFHLKQVPFVGARKMNKQLMEAVEPFDYSEMVPYNDAYLPGYYAERYNLTPNDMAQNVTWRMESYARQSCDAVNFEYESTRMTDGSIDIKNCKYSYALLPIWFLNYQEDGVYHGFAINGQTGEACGKLPYSKVKRIAALAKTIFFWLVLPIAVLASATFALMFGSLFNDPSGLLFRLSSYLMYGAMFLGSGILYVFLKMFRRKLVETTNPVDKAPDLSQYYDTSKKADVRRKDDLLGLYNMSKEEIDDLRREKIFKWIDKVF